MTILEKKSERKKKAIMGMVQNGEMSIFYAISEAERLNDEGKLLDNDYEEVAEYLESLLESKIEEVIENEQLDTEVNSTEETEPVESEVSE